MVWSELSHTVHMIGRRLQSVRGVVAIVTAIGAAMLFGFVGLAIDGGFWYGTHAALQVAADAGAMAAARQIDSSNASQSYLQSVAQSAAKKAVSTLRSSPAVGLVWNGGSVTVTTSAPEQLFFSEVVGYLGGNLVARATAGTAGGSQPCVLALTNSSTTGVLVQDNGTTVNSPDCAMYSDASGTSSVDINGGDVTVPVVGAVGSVVGAPTNTQVIQGGAILPDPYANLAVPIPSYGAGTCGTSCPASTAANVTTDLSPGYYGSGLDISKNSTVSLAPGVYYIDGNLTLNGDSTITGTGVTFYVTGSISWNGNNNTVSLSAPTSGTYSGVLIFQSRTDSNQASFSGNSTFNISGSIYTPDASVVFTGNDTTGPVVNITPGVGVNVVSQTVTVSGHATINTGEPPSTGGQTVGGTPFLSG